MKKSLYIFLFLILLIVSFAAGNRFNQRMSGQETVKTGARQILHYVDPMNPAHTTKEPGIAPCGMPMEPVYADDATVSGFGAVGGIPASPGQVRVNPHKQQIIGVQTGEVARSGETRTIRALGRVAADENLTYVLVAATDGWLGEIHGSTTGSLVDKNQLMAQIKIYEYDFFTWQRRFLTELSNVGHKRSFYTPTSGAGQMLEDIPAQLPGAMHTETTASAAPPVAGTPQGTGARPTLPGAEMSAPAAPLPAPPQPLAGDTSSMAAPQHHPGTEKTHVSNEQGSQPMTEDTQADSPHHGGKAPVLLKKRATLPEAARQNQARTVVVRESDGGLGYADEEDSFSASRGRLELLKLGVKESQLAELTKNKTYLTYAEFRSPVNGYVLARNVSPRQRIDRGAECFRIADLSRVWVEADVYASEAKYIQPGMQARVSLPKQGGNFMAAVSEVPPRFDPVSRSLKVRLILDNPEMIFRPDMFVDVEFLVAVPESIAVPVGAVIDSGKRKTVYVVKEEGVFEPREVATGWQLNDRVEIVEGLQPGEQIVVAGNFLIDSESRMKLAALRLMEDKAGNPHNEQRVPAVSAPPVVAPAPPASQPANSPIIPVEKSKDPVCGMTVRHDTAIADDLTFEVEGKTYYFCSADCKEQFKQEPKRFLVETAGKQASPPASVHGGHHHD